MIVAERKGQGQDCQQLSGVTRSRSNMWVMGYLCLGYNMSKTERIPQKVSRIPMRWYTSHPHVFNRLIPRTEEHWTKVRHAFLLLQSSYCLLEFKMCFLIKKRISKINDSFHWCLFRSRVRMQRQHRMHYDVIACYR